MNKAEIRVHISNLKSSRRVIKAMTNKDITKEISILERLVKGRKIKVRLNDDFHFTTLVYNIVNSLKLRTDEDDIHIWLK